MTDLATISTVPAHTSADYTITPTTAQLLLDATPTNTRAAYDHAWRRFTDWTTETGRTPLPATPQTLAEYTAAMTAASLAPATIDQAIGAIRTRHRRAGHPNTPDTTAALELLRAYRRTWADHGGRVTKATPLLLEGLRAICTTCDPSRPIDVRDRALILLGFNTMARRSELAGLDLADLELSREGLTVRIRRSKTDQAAAGTEVAVPYGQHPSTCAVRAVGAWCSLLTDRNVSDGALFRPIDRHGRIGTEASAAGKPSPRLTGKSVSAVVARRASAAGLEGRYSGHSLRAGAATVAYAAGAPVSAIAAHGRWSEKSPVVLGYIRAVDAWRNNPMLGVGL